ncbi:hypothetical protein BHE90_002213 [Fusarium euwallaceae]|uniref:Uncharacterized protein n=1 Tax=Fusarium euwallaceae TaxID=1147111 RepID=A0A430M5K4_9HYPO|nr:hypothetical protein BHE90_002213 [Fusarium euwallaceae]
MAPFNRAPGAPIQRTPSLSPSETSLGSRASLVECLGNLPRSSSTRRSSREILDQTVAQIAWEAKRAELQSQSNSWSFSRADLGSVPDRGFVPDLGSVPESAIDLTTCSTPESDIDSTADSTPDFNANSTTRSTPESDIDSTAVSTPGSDIDLITDPGLEQNVDLTAGSTLQSAIDLTTDYSESDLGSENPLDTSPTAGSMLDPPHRPASDSATQVDSRNTVNSPLNFTDLPLVRAICVTPAKRPAEQDEHSSGLAEVKRVRPGRQAPIPDCGCRYSPALAEATFRTPSPTVQHPEISDSAIEATTQLGNRSGSLLSGDAALGSSPAEALENARQTRSSTRVTRSSFSRVEAAAITPETPRHTQTSAEEISPSTSFASTTDGSPRARSSRTTPETDISSPTWTPTTALSPCPKFRVTAGDEDGASLPTPTSSASHVPQREQRVLRPRRTQPNADLGQKKGSARKEDTRDTSQPQTQSDDHAEEDCISVKAPKRQMGLLDYWTPEPKNHV